MEAILKPGKGFIFPVLGALVFFIVLWLLDYPKPMVDDLYYGGAALHLAQGGDFSNPLIERQEYPSHFFFVYPPLHSYVLLGWLKIFGVSALSLTGFQALLYFIIAASGIAILRKWEAPGFICWLVPLAVTTSLLPGGLRPEALSIALTMAGLALVEYGAAWRIMNFFAFLLMFAGVSVAPRLAFLSASVIVFSGYRIWKRLNHASEARTLLAMGAAAFLCAFMIFLAQIQFRFAEFWHTFQVHSQLVKGWNLLGFVGFVNENRYLDGSQSPLVWALGALMVFAWPKQRSALLQLSWALIAGFFLEGFAGALGAGVLWYVTFAFLLFVSAVIKSFPSLTLKLAAVATFLILLANVQFAMAEYQRVRGHVTMELGPNEKAAREIRSSPEHPVLIDSATARYIYDYKLPAGFLDIEFASPFPGSHILVHPRREDIYVIGPDNVEVLKQVTHLVLPIQQHALLGLYNRKLTCQPCKVYIIPAENLQFTGDLPK